MINVRQLGAFLLIGLIWGSEWIAQQAIEAPPLRALTMRYAIAAVLLACAMAVRPIRFPGWRTALAAATVGITLLAIPPILTRWASQRISSGLLVVILSLTPLLAALFEGQVAGWLTPLIGGVAGTALILSAGLSFDLTQGAAALAALAAAGFIAGSYVYAKRRLSAIHPVALAAVQFATGFAALACASLLIEGRSDWVWTRQTLIWEVVLSFFGNALALPLLYYLLKRLESFQAVSIQWAVTSISVAEGLVLLRQRPAWEMFTGVVVIAASFWNLLGWRSGNEEPLTIRVTRPPFEG